MEDHSKPHAYFVRRMFVFQLIDILSLIYYFLGLISIDEFMLGLGVRVETPSVSDFPRTSPFKFAIQNGFTNEESFL